MTDILVTSDEDPEVETGKGDGKFSPDAALSFTVGGEPVLRLRSERVRFGDGRVYLVYITATYKNGNTSRMVLRVDVATDQNPKTGPQRSLTAATKNR